jgi:hypothetical protein
MAIGAGIRKRDQAGVRLEAIFPVNWRSWGESVGVDVLGVDGDALVQVKSRSRLPTTLIDWGKNADNVRRFLSALAK